MNLSPRRVAKAVAEWTLVESGVATSLRRVRRLDCVILAYHNVVPDHFSPAGDSSLHIGLTRFREHLDEVSRTHDIVPVPELFGPSHSGRPRAAVTFDDAYIGALILGIPEAVRRGIPVTVFVAPGILGGRSMWWDELAERGEVDAARRQVCLEDLGGDDAAIRQYAIGQGWALRPAPPEMLTGTEAQLRDAVRAPGVSVGSHSWSHPNLARLPSEALREELRKSRTWIADRFPNVITWVAYPYGCVDAAVMAAAGGASYSGGALVAGGSFHGGGPPRFDVPRVNVARGLTSRGLALRLCGL